MFYSIELLGKKTALGAVWVAAHGKKLNRNKVMGVNIVDICNKIMDPEVPHALRLQGILVGGVAVIFDKQQLILLEDCQEMMKKLRAVIASGDSKLLDKDRSTARRQAITLPEAGDQEMQLQVQDLDVSFLHAGSGWPLDNSVTSDGDLFIMPTVETSMAAASEGALRDGGGVGQTLDQGLSAMHDMDLDAALLDGQPECFEAGGMDMDLAFDAVLQPDLGDVGAPDAGDFAAPEELPMDPPGPAADAGGTPGTLPVPTAEPEGERAAQMNGAEARKRASKSRKRQGGPIFDEAIIIDSKVIRSWTTDSAALVRPRSRIRLAPAPAAALQALSLRPATEAAGAGAQWAPPLTRLLAKRLSPVAAGCGGTEEEETPGPAKRARANALPAGDAAPEHTPLQPGDMVPLAAGLGVDMPAFDDAPLPDGLPPDGLDDDIEQIRRALSTPGSNLNARLAMSPGSSNPLGAQPVHMSNALTCFDNLFFPQSLGSVQARCSRPSSGKRPGSGDGQPSDRRTPSMPGSRRLSDVDEGGAAGAPGVEGALDDLLPMDEVFEGGHEAGALTQFQAVGGSLLEESAAMTQPQLAGTPLGTQPHTRGLASVLRKRFAQTEQLSLFALTARMTRKEAAQLFYQVCVMSAGSLIRAAQAGPYDDIVICAGPML